MTTAVREVLVAMQPSAASGGKLEDAMGAWQRAREEVYDTLDELSDAIDAAKYPESPKAIILVRAIQANLTERPESQRQAAELDRYLQTDEIIGHAEAKNGWGIRVRIRQPLLEALAALKPHLAE